MESPSCNKHIKSKFEKLISTNFFIIYLHLKGVNINIISLIVSFSYQSKLVIFHWRLSDSKVSQVSTQSEQCCSLNSFNFFPWFPIPQAFFFFSLSDHSKRINYNCQDARICLSFHFHFIFTLLSSRKAKSTRQQVHLFIVNQPYVYCGVMIKALDNGIVVSELQLKSRNYVLFQTSTLWKSMNPTMGEIVSLLTFRKDEFGIK